MQLNNYTSIDLTPNNIIKSTDVGYHSTYIEKVLLMFIAAIGILGSIYVFTASSGSNISPEFSNVAFASILQDDEAAEMKGGFNKYIKIEGEKNVGEQLTFTFKKDRVSTRYVLEMGNGERMIITGDTWPYTYKKAGKYTLELKKIERGLISLVASKKIKIKE